MKATATFVALATLAAFATQASAQIATSVSIQFSPAKSRYARGETFDVIYTLKTQYGILPGAPLTIGDYGNDDPLQCSFYRTTTTDGNGQVRIRYRVPTSPFADNVRLFGVFTYGYPFNVSGKDVRIPIGL